MIGNASHFRTMNGTMQEALRLVRSGDLNAATQAIQRGLHAPHPGAPANTDAGVPARPDDSVLEGEYRVVADRAPQPDAVDTPLRDDTTVPHSDGRFREHRFTCSAGAIDYKLFVPTGLAGTAAPLLIMLHGCTQSPDDFARGTRMNAVAQERGYVVAYPAQSRKRNATGCWNWFRRGDQQRGKGEAVLLAELTRHLVETHRLDAKRVYVAGLSAGGAMAAVLADAYPDVYAAIGVHSGLPSGVAHDLPSALAAMRQGGRSTAASSDPVPAIVFHGDQDTTVDPRNGAAVIVQSTRATAPGADSTAGLRATPERGTVAGGRSFTRTIYRDNEGRVAAELWTVHGGGHAWSGGDSGGSYTDPSGPDASEHMLRFFSACSGTTTDNLRSQT